MQAIFCDFVASAAAARQRDGKFAKPGQSGKPRLVILTASSNDAFEYASDCNQLDSLRFEWNGVHSRTANYPELAKLQRDFCLRPERMQQRVDSADAFFINGGNQSLTLRSLQLEPGKFTPLAQRLLDRVTAGIPLSGSSACTAVQSGNRAGTIPMFSGGSSAHALRHGLQAHSHRPVLEGRTARASSGATGHRQCLDGGGRRVQERHLTRQPFRCGSGRSAWRPLN